MIYFKKSWEKRVSPFQLFAAALPPLETPQIRVGNPVKIKTWGFYFPAYFSPSFISPPASELTDPIPGKTPVPKRCGASPGAALPIPTSSSGACQKPTTFPLAIYPIPFLFIPRLRAEDAALTRAPGAAPAMALPVCARRARLTSDFSRRIKL